MHLAAPQLQPGWRLYIIAMCLTSCDNGPRALQLDCLRHNQAGKGQPPAAQQQWGTSWHLLEAYCMTTLTSSDWYRHKLATNVSVAYLARG